MILKKLISKSLVVFSIFSAVATASISANAASIVTTVNTSDIFTYSNHWSGSHSSLYAYPGYTGITTSDFNYYGAFKKAGYQAVGTSNGIDYTIYSDTEAGTNRTLTTDPYSPTYAMAKRIHTGELHLTSDSTTSIVDSYSITIVKTP